MSEQSDTPRTDAAIHGMKFVGCPDFEYVDVIVARALERELAAVTRERDEWAFAARNEAKLAQVVVRERDEARAEVERLRGEIERAAIACSHGESQAARAILLNAMEANP